MSILAQPSPGSTSVVSPVPGAGKSRVSDIAQSWGELLSAHPWEWFATLTFPDFPHPEKAFKQYRVWMNKLNRELYGPRYYKDPRKGCVWVCGVEYQKRGSIHFHALIYAPDVHSPLSDVHRITWAEVWQEITGGFAMILVPFNREACSVYCAKYAAKGGEIEFSPTFVTRHTEAVEFYKEHVARKGARSAKADRHS